MAVIVEGVVVLATTVTLGQSLVAVTWMPIVVAELE